MLSLPGAQPSGGLILYPQHESLPDLPGLLPGYFSRLRADCVSAHAYGPDSLLGKAHRDPTQPL